jgi:hypothetical protein
VLIVLLLQKLKGFGDMKNSIPKPEDQKRYLSRGSQGGQRHFSCKSKIFSLVSLRSLRALREESVSAVCLMLVQNQNDNEKFMGQQ